MPLFSDIYDSIPEESELHLYSEDKIHSKLKNSHCSVFQKRVRSSWGAMDKKLFDKFFPGELQGHAEKQCTMDHINSKWFS